MSKNRSRKKLLPIIGAAVLALLLIGAVASFLLTRSLSDRINDIHAGDAALLEQNSQGIVEAFGKNVQSVYEFIDGIDRILTDGTMRDADKLTAARTVEDLAADCTAYLLAENGNFFRLDSTRGKLADNSGLQTILASGRKGLLRGKVAGDGDSLLMVIPVSKRGILGFGYEAIALAMPIKSDVLLNLGSHAGGEDAFACTPEGTVLQSAGENTLNPENVLTYFSSHGLDEEASQTFAERLGARKSGSLLFDEGNYQIYYRPAEYENLMLVTVTPDTALHNGSTVQRGGGLTSFVLLLAAGVMAAFLLLIAIIVILAQRLYRKQKNFALVAMMAEQSSDLYIILERKNYHVEYVSNGMELAFGIPISYIQNNYHSLDACAKHAILWPVTKLRRLGPGAKVHETVVLINVKTEVPREYDITAVRPKPPYDGYVMFVFSAAAKEAASPETDQMDELLHSKKKNAVGQMFFQLLGPLNEVSERIGLAKTHLQDTEQMEHDLTVLEEICRRMNRTVTAVQGLRYFESGTAQLAVEQITLPEIIEDVFDGLQTLAASKKQIIRARCDNVTHERILGDKKRIVSVLKIILANAVNYTPDGGNISFVVEEKSYTDKGKIVYEFRIKDNGIGMSEEFRRRIFEPFTREDSAFVSKINGDGLGMAMANSIVKCMNGRIVVASQLDAGTQVMVTLAFDTWQGAADADILPETVKAPNLLVVYEREKQAIQIVKAAVRLGCVARRTKLEDYYTDTMQGGPYSHILVELPYRNDRLWNEIQQLQSLQPEAQIVIYGRLTSEDIAQVKAHGFVRWLNTPVFISSLKDMVLGKQEEIQAAGPVLDKKKFAGKRVLLASTMRHREMIEESLGSLGMLVESTSEGQQTMIRLENAPVGTYDLLLTELKLPTLDGYQLAKHLRKSDRADLMTMPIVGLCETVLEEVHHRALMAGMNACITHPFRVEDFMEAAYHLI